MAVRGTPLARPLIEAILEEIGRCGAYPILQLTFEQVGGPFERHAPLGLLREAAPLQQTIWADADAFISIWAPERIGEGADLSPERRAALEESRRPMRARTMAGEVPWVIAAYPVPSVADEASMGVDELEELIYASCLLDWDAEGARMRKIADVFDEADQVRITGAGTDLTLSLAGRHGAVDDAHINMPGGEVFYSPIEDSADGVVEFSEFPAVSYGREVHGARLVFRGGRVVDASARRGEAVLIEVLDTDAGSRGLGELGIGCNPGIQRFMKNVAFDEKIDGTIHLALGNSYASTGGLNVSAIHWDIVKDLRTEGAIYADGRMVQENGRWLI